MEKIQDELWQVIAHIGDIIDEYAELDLMEIHTWLTTIALQEESV